LLSLSLGVLLRLSSLLCPHFSAALVALHSAQGTQCSEDLLGGGVTDGFEFLCSLGVSDWEWVAVDLVGSGGRLQLLSGGVVDQSSLGLAFAAWEQDHLGLVGLETVHVELQLLSARVGPSVINSDANSAGESCSQAGLVEFIKGEATSVSHLALVLLGGRGNHGAELLDRAGERLGRLCDSTLVSSKLLGWLVEVALCSAVPVLAQMDVWDCVVVLDHC
jgi:hypothetical protein